MLLLVTKNTQGPMTLLELRRENACPRVFASGYIDGDIRGANVKGSSVSTRLLICERGLDYRQGGKREVRKICVVTGLLCYGAVCWAYLQCYQNVGEPCPVWTVGNRTYHIYCMF